MFPKEAPQRCTSVQTITIVPAQCKLLMEWATMGQLAPKTNLFSQSKSQLKSELERLKPKIEMKLESLYDKSTMV
jgi:hypothetical protein